MASWQITDNEDHIQTLEALAATLIPVDEFDGGVQTLDFASFVERRAGHETGRAELYATALTAVDKMAQSLFHKPRFVDLSFSERSALLDAVRQGRVDSDLWGQIKPGSFFNALWEDVVFLYCTHPEIWQRIGFPGPSFDKGGYSDFDQPQTFTGR